MATCTNTILQSPFTNWAMAATNIQWAVDMAMTNLPAKVWVTNGAYCVTNQITITNSVTLQSVTGYSNTLVYAAWPTYTTRCFYVANTGILDGFTISNGHWWGNATLGGGGAYIGSSSTVQNCYFTYNACSNTASAGGGGVGVYASGGTIRACYFVTNICFMGFAGGGYFSGSLIDNCDFIMNRCGDYSGGGGGVYMSGSSSLQDSRVISNTTSRHGGGIYTSWMGGSISRCLVASNRGSGDGQGEGIIHGDTAGNITDCVISNNYGGQGGGIHASRSAAILRCSIANNRSGSFGGSVVYAGYNVSMSNCTVAGNTGALGGGISADELASFYYCQISNNLNTGGVGGGGMLLTVKDNFLRQCLIVNNTNQSGFGGGVYISASGARFESCTVAGNYSTNDGGGMNVPKIAGLGIPS